MILRPHKNAAFKDIQQQEKPMKNEVFCWLRNTVCIGAVILLGLLPFTQQDKSSTPPQPFDPEDGTWRRSQVGLPNIGNSCYMNSAVQALACIPPFAEYFLQHKDDSPKDKNSLSKTFGDVIRLLANQNQQMNPNEFNPYMNNLRNSLQNTITSFFNSDQQDTDEFIVQTSDWISTEMIHSDDRSSGEFSQDIDYANTDGVLAMFYLGYSKVITCASGGLEKKKKEHSNTIRLCISEENKKNSTLELKDLLKEYFSAQPIVLKWEKNSDKFGDDQNQECENIIKIEQFPDVLKITVGLFEYDPRQKKISKFSGQIDFALEIDLSSYSSSDQTSNAVYDLISIIVHEGKTVNSGHYYAYGRVNDSNDSWHEFNDENVNKVTSAKMLRSATPYILFYKLRPVAQILPKKETYSQDNAD